MKYTVQHATELLDALQEMHPDSSKTTLRSWLKDGRVTVDDVVRKLAHFTVEPGQEIVVGTKPKVIEGNIEVLYEDSDLVIVNKPHKLLSVSTAFEKNETVFSFLKRKYRTRTVQIVHRLDEDTSGVMVFAFSETAYKGLKELFEKHEIDRCYWAIVEGYVKNPKGTWQSYLYEDENYVVHETTDKEKGRLAITHYQVKQTRKLWSWLELKLETGRKNQIRVHCQSAGHPILGDVKYGTGAIPAKRLCLHAFLLGFVHPVTKKYMRFESKPPEIFNRFK